VPPISRRRRGSLMKKWFVIALALLMLSGCSFSTVKKWFDKMDWERDDQTIRIVDFFLR
jgi:hypothetical protein